MKRILVLNASYEPLQIVSWKKAIRLLIQEKVEVLAEYECVVRSVSLSLRLPSVLRLRQYVKLRPYHYRVKFNRTNIYVRDNHSCQYCGRRFPAALLTYDHVVPVSRGGSKNWENIVTCCIDCNRKKGDHTPEEVGLVLLRRPKAPLGFPARIRYLLHQTQAPESWHSFIFFS